MQSSESSDDTQFIKSKLTFVDLAGSERIKRTGAEGQRMKEGIQINSGLFNLGQVINGLADDQRIKNGTKAGHIPYRNSKLTHLLKDALGGNSQTLFLACVSPAESNESETYSTLSYARQARNIKNKPLRNIDKHQLELRRLKYAVKTWMSKAITHMFSDQSTSNANRLDVDDTSLQSISLTELSSPQAKGNSRSGSTRELFNRPEVQEYVQRINDMINAQLEGGLSSSPRKLRLSIMPSPRTRGGDISASPAKAGRELFRRDSSDGMNLCVENASRRRSLAKCHAVLESDSEQLVSRMMELVHKEKDELLKDTLRPESPTNSSIISGQTNITCSTDGIVDDDEDEDCAKMAHVEREIEEKEEILEKLMEAVKGFGAMKQDYESLLQEINSLESEKAELERDLEQAKKLEESLAKSKKPPANPLAVIKLKERFAKVQSELAKMKTDRQKKESAYRLMQRESKQCERLQDELKKMKEAKVALMRAQKTQSMNVQKMRKENDQKISQMKKSDMRKQRQVNNLKSELVKKQRVLGNKDREIARIQSKLKSCEEHITQLLTMNNKKRAQLMSTPSKERGFTRKDSGSNVLGGLSTSDKNHLKSSKSILDNMIADRIDRQEKKIMYDNKVKAHQDLKEELSEEVTELQTLTAKKLQLEEIKKEDEEHFTEEQHSQLKATSQAVISVQDSIDKITHEMKMYISDIDELSTALFQYGKDNSKDADEGNGTWEDMGKSIVNGLNHGQCQSLLWDMTIEKSGHLIQIEEYKRKYLESKDACESATETISELENELLQSKSEMKARLEESEKQRVNDLWALMKSKAAAEEGKVGQSIAITRAQDLEKALESYVEQESTLKNEIEALRAKNEELHKKSLEINFLKSGEGDNNAELQVCFTELKAIWDCLGTPVNEREEVLSSISCANKTAQSESLKEAELKLQSSKTEEDVLTTGFEDMCGVLDIEEGSYFDEATLKTLPILKRIEQIKEAFQKVEKEMSLRTVQMFKLKAKLLDLMKDMKLEHDNLSPNLQRLLRVDADMESATIPKLASDMLAKGVMISVSHLEEWDSKIRELSVEQVDNINQSNCSKQDIAALCEELSLSIHDRIESIECGIDKAMKERICAVLTNAGEAKVTGDNGLKHCLEKVCYALQTMKANRTNCVKFLQKLFKGLNNYLKLSFDKTEESSSCVTSEYLETLFGFFLTSLPVQLEKHVEYTQIKLAGMVTDNKLSVAEYDQKLGKLASTQVKTKEEIAMLSDMDEPINDLVGLSQFSDEAWLVEFITSVQNVWHENRSQVIFAIVLGSEMNRLNLFVDALKDIKRFDNQLSRHVTEMEEFELASKQDRLKVLSGSSKALMEEEKYRKNGKRKFEQITDRLVMAARTAQSYSDGMQMDISHLSRQGQDLLRGKVQERIELMHLHTTTHGTKRWSGDKETFCDTSSQSSQDENIINNQENRHEAVKPVSSRSTKSPTKLRSRSKSPVNSNCSSPVNRPRSRNIRKENEGFPREQPSNPFSSLLKTE